MQKEKHRGCALGFMLAGTMLLSAPGRIAAEASPAPPAAPAVGTVGRAADEAPAIGGVFFAQHHVLAPDNPLFKLVGNLEALIKVQVYSEAPTPAPMVFARLELNSETLEVPLTGPAILTKPPAGDPILMKQSYSDSFTAVIPREWVKPGLKVTLELRNYDYSKLSLDDTDYSKDTGKSVVVTDRLVLDHLNIGAPTKLPLTMFDIHYFGGGKGADEPEGWIEELKTKLPVAELEVRRVSNIMFDELVMPPLFGLPAGRYSSAEDFKKKTGHDYDGEQGIALMWVRALKQAAGRFGGWRLYWINICGVHAGGQAGGFAGVGSLHRHGVLVHELGHAFGLPHWAENKRYPYRGTMYGISAGAEDVPHAGPTWAFDLRRRAFIPPTVQENSVGGTVGTWKKDPMHGGGMGDQEKTYMYRHFSDYSVSRIRSYLEGRVVYWDEKAGNYVRWNQDKGSYADVVENDGMQFPVERDVDVISVLVSASAVTPEANIIYAPIGPYRAGLVDLFEATSAEDRKRGQTSGYTASSCNVCLRVTQGGKVKTYLLPVKVSPDDDPLNGSSFHVTAVNLPARAGEVTQADLLHAPAVTEQGLAGDLKVLSSWRGPQSTPQR